ncbi:unnamed protein product [Alternaria alternata]
MDAIKVEIKYRQYNMIGEILPGSSPFALTIRITDVVVSNNFRPSKTFNRHGFATAGRRINYFTTRISPMYLNERIKHEIEEKGVIWMLQGKSVAGYKVSTNDLELADTHMYHGHIEALPYIEVIENEIRSVKNRPLRKAYDHF